MGVKIEALTFISENSLLSAIVAGLVVAAVAGAVRLIHSFWNSSEKGTRSLVVKGDGNLINIVDSEALSLFPLNDNSERAGYARYDDDDFFNLGEERASCQIRSNAFGEELLISKSYDDHARVLGLAFDGEPYIVHLLVNYYLKEDSSELMMSVYGEKEGVTKVGALSGSLILGRQMFEDGADFWQCCDDCSGDLEVMASDILAAGLLMSSEGRYRNVLYIDSIELSSRMIEGRGIGIVFDTIPQVIFEEYNVKPDLLCYLIATSKEYYDWAEEKAELDSRSVDKGSPLLFIENGFSIANPRDGLGKTLYKITENIELPIMC